MALNVVIRQVLHVHASTSLIALWVRYQGQTVMFDAVNISHVVNVELKVNHERHARLSLRKRLFGAVYKLPYVSGFPVQFLAHHAKTRLGAGR